MTKELSKYALKQLTDEERVEYEAALETEKNRVRRVCGGEVHVDANSAYGGWNIESYDIDGFPVEQDYTADVDELLDIIACMEEELADIQDGKEEDDS